MKLSGTTTDNYTTIMDASYGDHPLFVVGSLENKNALNVILIRLTLKNIFDDEETNTLQVSALGLWKFTSFDSLLSINPLYKSIKIEIKSLLSGFHANYNFTATGSAL